MGDSLVSCDIGNLQFALQQDAVINEALQLTFDRRVFGGGGFHRSLETQASIELRSPSHIAAGLRCHEWAAVERFPAAMFVDPYQVRRAARRALLGGADDIVIRERNISVEGLAYESAPINAIVVGRLDDWILRSSVPVHLRYDAAATARENMTHRPIRLPPPKVFLCCTPDDATPRAGSRQYAWRQAATSGELPVLTALVPVGHAPSGPYVLAATSITILLAACSVLRALTTAPRPSSGYEQDRGAPQQVPQDVAVDRAFVGQAVKVNRIRSESMGESLR